MKKIIVAFIAFFCLFLSSCEKTNKIRTVDQQQLFSINYGLYENELRLSGNNAYNPVEARIAMQDGFFYVSDGYAKKIMQFTSYGDLTGIIYNDKTNPEPSFIHKIGSLAENAQNGIKSATKNAQSYDFNQIQKMAIDSDKNIFIVDTLASERKELDTEENILMKEIVLHFERDGTFKGYYGQEGLGGTPFPTIADIFTTKNDELVVVCVPKNEDYMIYWYNKNGALKWKIPLLANYLPQNDEEVFTSIDRIVPDYSEMKLYIKTDYYKVSTDEELNVQSGIEYSHSLMHQFNIEEETFSTPLEIPPYEDVIVDRFAKLTYKIPYNFLGVSANQNFFFMMPDETGLIIQIMSGNWQKAIKRHIKYDTLEAIHSNFALSDDGIISALIALPDRTQIVWWRTDNLIDKH